MSAPSLEQKIWFNAGLKRPRTRICKSVRSRTGFEVSWKSGDHVFWRETVPSKKQALQMILAKIRCLAVMKFEVRKAVKA